MRVFGVGLEDSVMKEPTQINLGDWANLCLFRLAIIRRRITSAKLYVDKTSSAETLYKLDAFLWKLYDVIILILILKFFFCNIIQLKYYYFLSIDFLLFN